MVRRKAARDRVRNRGVVIAVVVSVIGVATFGITRQSHGVDHVIVRNPVPSSGDVADFNWTRVDTPLAIEHIATVNGQTLATGEALVSGTSTAPAIAEIDTNGVATITFEDTPAAGGGLTEIDDVAAVPGSADSLVAVGVAAVPNGRFGGAAWRSTDDGNTWQRARRRSAPRICEPAGVLVAPASCRRRERCRLRVRIVVPERFRFAVPVDLVVDRRKPLQLQPGTGTIRVRPPRRGNQRALRRIGHLERRERRERDRVGLRRDRMGLASDLDRASSAGERREQQRRRIRRGRIDGSVRGLRELGCRDLVESRRR